MGVIRGVTSNSTGAGAAAATRTLAKPANLVNGDVCLIWCNALLVTATFSSPGWTAITAATNSPLAFQLLWRVIDGTETWPITVTSSGPAIFACGAVGVGAVNVGAVFDPSAPAGSGQTGSSATPTATGVTTLSPNDAVLWLCAVRSTGSAGAPPTVTLPAGFQTTLAQVNTSSASAFNVGIVVGDSAGPSALGATGNKAGSCTSTLWGALLVALTAVPPVELTPEGVAQVNGQTYYWRARAVATGGAVSAWTTAAHFTTKTTDTAPNTPTLSGPAGTVTNPTVTLGWTFTDPDGGDTQSAWAVRSALAGGAYAYWNAATAAWQAAEVANPGTATSLTVTLPLGSWAWSAKVWDTLGPLASAYPADATFTVAAAPPLAIAPPVTPAVAATFTDGQLLSLAPGVGQRQADFVFEVLDKGGHVIGQVYPDRDSPPQIQCDVTRVQTRQLTGLVLTPADVTNINRWVTGKADVNGLFAARIRPSMVMPSGSRWPLGVYLFADAPRSVATYGNLGPAGDARVAFMTASLTEQGLILEGALQQGLTLAKGTVVTAAISKLLAGLPLLGYQVDPTDQTALGEPKSYPAGTAVSEVLKDLTTQIGYHDVFFDNTGTARAKEVSPNPTAYDLSYQVGGNIYADGILIADSVLSDPNRWIVVDSSSKLPLAGVYDVPDSSPGSFRNRGYYVTRVESQSALADKTAATKAAAALAAKAGRTTTITFAGAPDPRHDVHMILNVMGVLYRETSFTMVLQEGEAMTHTATRIYG